MKCSFATAVTIALLAVSGWGMDAAAAEPLEFNRDIRPILSEHCFQCHGPDAEARKADLRLDDAGAARHVLKPENLGKSELLKRILSTDADERMPPTDSKKPLSDEQKRILARWIDEGARYQPHWAFVPPVRAPIPDVKHSTWVRNAIDRFILQRLDALGLMPSTDADRATLLRRVTLDLTGLPPTPGEVAEFVADQSDAAYERQVDRLLASPRYGEHMAAGWLEAARYADTDGYQNGWAQLDSGEPASALASDAYATGSALVALQQTGELASSDPAYQKGLAYLLKTQLPDGSWHIISRSKPFQPYYESGFPHAKDQFISCAATGWATWAMILAIDK